MPAPTNISAATATQLNEPPYATTQSGIHDAGTTYTVWFRYTEIFRSRVIGFFFFGDLVTYRPTIDAYTPDFPPGGSSFVSVQNRPIQLQVELGATYYFEITPNAGNPTPATLTIDLDSDPTDEIPPGSIVINDDTDGFPAAIVSRVSGEVIGFTRDFPAGEAGDVLRDGTTLVSDAWNGNVQLYSPTRVNLGTIAFDIGFSPAIRTQRVLNTFWAGNQDTPPVVREISGDGETLNTYTLTGYASLTGLAANNDGTILYHSRSTGASSAIRRWDLSTNAATTDLVAGVVGATGSFDLLVLPDDTILSSQTVIATGQFYVNRYDASGALLRTYSIATTSEQPASTVPRMAYAMDDTSFWVFYHLDGGDLGYSRLENIRLSDAAVLQSITVPQFEGGAFRGTASADPPRFGVSFSCPIWATREGMTLLPSELCCPCECPPPRRAGTPARAPLESATGPIIPPEDPSTMEFACVGGGDVPTAADLTDTESWVS
jgi:hypothetical protein